MGTPLSPAPSALPIARLLARRSITSSADVRSALEALHREGLLDLPAPGDGTRAHHAALVEIAAVDLSLARLAEGHSDARAILAELRVTPGDGTYGVWAAEPADASVGATRSGAAWRLTGTKRYASGARSIDRALVTAGPLLFDVDLRARGVGVRDCWVAVGMADSESHDVVLEDVEARLVAEDNAYVTRPGFEHGGVRVAAVWLGGAIGAARMVLGYLGKKRDVDAHQAAALAEAVSTCTAMQTVIDAAADAIDADPEDLARDAATRTLHVRRVIEDGATSVLRACGRASGSSPLVFERAHARRAADLAVYLRQHHAGRDLERLGRRYLEDRAC